MKDGKVKKGIEVSEKEARRNTKERGKATPETSAAHNFSKMMDDVARLQIGIKRRGEVEEALKGSNEFHSTLMGLSNDLIFSTDLKGNFLFTTKAIQKHLGYSEEDLKDMTAFDIVHPEDLDKARNCFNELLKGESVNDHEYRFMTKDGNHIFCSSNCAPIFDDQGNIVAAFNVARNITERKNAEIELTNAYEGLENRVKDRTAELEAANEKLKVEIAEREEAERQLKRSETRFRSFADKAGAGIAMTDLEGKFTYVNRALSEMTGHSDEELLGKEFLDFIHEDDKERIMGVFMSAFEDPHQDIILNYRVMHKDGNVVHLESKPTVLWDGDDMAGFSAIVTDVSERNKAREAQLASEEEYKTLFEKSPTSITLVDMKGVITDCNESTEKLIGYSKEEIIGKPFDKLMTLKPDNLPKLQEIFGDLVKGHDIEPYELEIVCKDGRSKWIDVVNSIQTKDDAIVGFQVICTDNTEKKLAEKALKSSEERLSLFMESATDGFALFDSDLNITDINTTLLEVVPGTKKEQVIGKNITQLIPDIKETGRLKRYKKVMETEEPLFLEDLVPHPRFGSIHISVKAFKVGAGLGLIVTDITERTRAEAALRESEEKFRSLAEKSPNMIFINKGGKVVYANEECERAMGFAREEFYSPSFNFMSLITPESMETVVDAYEKHRRGEEVSPYEYSLQVKGGKKIDVINATKLIKYGNEPAILGIVTDITERKMAEEALRKSEKELEIRNRIANVFLTKPDEEMYKEVLDVILEGLESEYGVFGYVNEDGAFVVPTMTRHIWNQCQVEDKNVVFPREAWGDSTWPQAIREKKTIHSNEPSTNIPEGHIAVERHVSLPIIHMGEVIGLIQVANKKEDYTEEDLQLLNTLANHIAPILNARLVSDRRDRARKTAEENLKESEEKFRAISEQSLMAIGILQDGVFRYANDRAAELTGYSIDEILHWKPEEFADTIHPDDLPKILELGEGKRQGEIEIVSNHPFRIITKSGEMKWVENHSVMIDYGGKKADLINLIDITERKKAEEALSESERRYAALVDNSTDGVVMVQDGKLKLVSGEYIQELGFSSEEMIGMDFLEFVAPESRELVMKRYADRMAGKEVPTFYEIEILKKDGTTTPVEVTAALVESDGKPADLVSVRDISERIKAREALQYRLDMENLIASISTEFINLGTEEIDKGINQALEKLGQFADVDRSYVFQFSDSNTVMDNTHEWCGDGIEPQIDRVKGVPVETFQWGVDQVLQSKHWSCTNVDDLTEESKATREELVAQGIKSVLAVPLVIGGHPVGFIGFDSVKERRVWTDELVSMLKIIGEIVSNALARKKNEDALRKREKHFHSLVENSSDIIMILDSERKVQYASPSTERILGYEPQSLIDKPLCEYAHPDDLQSAKDGYDSAIQKRGFAIPSEMRVRHENGSWRCFEFVTNNLMDDPNVKGVVVNARDITDRRQAEIDIKESKELFEKIYTSQQDAIFLLDDQIPPVILDCNPSATKMFGYEREELLGQTTYSLHVDEGSFSKFQERSMQRSSEKGLVQHFDWHMKRRDGVIFPADHSIVPIEDDKGRRTGWLVVVRDISDRKQAEEAKNRLLSNISHELRTPLTSIEGYTKFMASEKIGKMSDKQKKCLEVVSEESDRLRNLIDNFLDLTTIQDDGVQADQEEVRITDIIKSLSESQRVELDKKGISLHQELPPESKPVKGDSEKLYRLFSNLLSNAIKFTPNGGSIEIKSKQDGENVVVEVADNGIGIPPDDVPRVFDRFYQVETSPARRFGGMGLGLSICKEIVEAHGGSIEVESTVGSGSVFRVTLPNAKEVQNVEEENNGG